MNIPRADEGRPGTAGDGLAHAVPNHVVHQVGHAAMPDFTGVEHFVSEGVQYRLHPVKHLPVAAHHHRQVA